MSKNESAEKKYPEGHFVGMWMGICIAIFTGAWIPISFILEMPGLIGIGPALGVSVGVAIGTSVEAKYKKEGRIIPSTKQQESKKKVAVLAGILVLAVLFAILFLLFLL